MGFESFPKPKQEKESSGEEQLTKEENKVLEIGINLHKALKEYDDVRPDMLARKQEDSFLEIYGKKVDVLNEQFHAELDKVPGSREKIMEKLRSEKARLGLEKNQYTGEYIKPSQN
ncbi:hypothetical protein KKA39_00700 [Patescibacteria group bacterium]|nr:hypothetical protein [Patescibacteria group bacterium]MBU1727819.1 hypothetical protein [Patescibacteria group bacterium]